MMKRLFILFLILCIAVFLFSAFKIKNEKVKKVLIVVPDKDFNDVEFAIAYARLKTAELTINIASPGGSMTKSNKSLEIKSDLKISDVDETDYVTFDSLICFVRFFVL